MSNCGGCNCSSADGNHCPKKYNQYLIKYNINIRDKINKQNINNLKSRLLKIEGIESANLEESLLEIYYDDILVSSENIDRTVEIFNN